MGTLGKVGRYVVFCPRFLPRLLSHQRLSMEVQLWTLDCSKSEISLQGIRDYIVFEHCLGSLRNAQYVAIFRISYQAPNYPCTALSLCKDSVWS